LVYIILAYAAIALRWNKGCFVPWIQLTQLNCPPTGSRFANTPPRPSVPKCGPVQVDRMNPCVKTTLQMLRFVSDRDPLPRLGLMPYSLRPTDNLPSFPTDTTSTTPRGYKPINARIPGPAPLAKWGRKHNIILTPVTSRVGIAARRPHPTTPKAILPGLGEHQASVS
jgi:hypothetical protein